MNNTTAELLESLQALNGYEENRRRVVAIVPNLVKVYGRVVLVSCELGEGNENHPEYRVAFASDIDTEATGATFDEAVLALANVMKLKQIEKVTK